MNTRKARGRTIEAAILLGCLALVAAIWGVTAQRIAFERAGDVREAVRQHANLALALEQHIIRTVKSIDQSLLFLKHEHERHGMRVDIPERIASGELDPSIFTALFVVDESGRVHSSSVAAAQESISDNESFLAHRTDPSLGLLIGAPLKGRVSGSYTIPLTRRLSRPDGGFAGMVVAGLKPEYFTQFYDLVDLEESGVVLLASLKGVVLARRAGTAASAGIDIRGSTLLSRALGQDAGSFESLGKLDGVRRLVSYRGLRELGLVVAVGNSRQAVLAATERRANAYISGAALATLFVGAFGGALVLAIRRQKRAAETAFAGERLYRVAMQEAPVGIAHQALDGRYLRVNPRFCAMLGYTEEELKARRFQDVLHPEDAATGDEFGEFFRVGRLERAARHVRKDGTLLWGMVALALVRDAAGRPDYVVTMVQDIGARKEAERRALEAEAPYRATFEQAGVGIAHAALDGRLVKANRRFASLLGYAQDELLGRSISDITHRDDVAVMLRHVASVITHGTGFSAGYEKRYLRKDGGVAWAQVDVSLVRDAELRPAYFIAVVQDITARKDAEAQLAHQAQYDALTDLPNRALLFDRLSQAISQARRKHWSAAALYLNLDRFKVVNETLGHEAGDRLLREAAERLSACVRAGDTVARVGGDEFVLALAELGAPDHAANVARKVLGAMSRPFFPGGEEVFVTASVGIATFPADGGDAETLVRNGAAAMQRAKDIGRSDFQFYTTAINEHSAERLRLEASLRRALERDEFRLHFQPRARIADGARAGFEALLRWQRNGSGLVPPGSFVPLLEESGLIVPVGEWVIDAACAQIAAWREAGYAPLPVAVNVAAKQFVHGDLDAVVARALAAHGVEPDLLEIEITESDAMLEPERTIATLEKLRARGLRVAIDDFGTGYSSLGYLKRFPVDLLKLDRSFVTGLPKDSDDVSIARAVIAMAHSLGLKVVAEGVETEAQRAFLAANGCDYLQGYLLARPLPAETCTEFLPLGVSTAKAAA